MGYGPGSRFCLHPKMVFKKKIKCAKITGIDRQRSEMKSRLWLLNQNVWSLGKLHCKLLVALATISVAILSLGMAIKYCVWATLACSVVKVKG